MTERTLKVVDGKVYNEAGEVAVIYSPDYGGTWRHSRFIPALVRLIVAGDRDAVAAKVNEMFPPSIPGWDFNDELAVEWMTPGQKYRVIEYDGSESIEYPEDIDWETA